MNNTLSSKDLSYVEDMFNWNLNIYKTCANLENQIIDEELKKLVTHMMKEHSTAAKNICEVIK